MLAKNYDPKKHNVLGWWWSEKLDGVRAIYTPDGRFWTRNGKELAAPWSFVGPMMKKIKLLPGEMLDGELYLGRGQFNECSGTVRRKDDQMWSGITYQVFDIIGYNEDFTVRNMHLEGIVGWCEVPHVVHVEQKKIEDLLDIACEFQSIINQGGEGLMLKRGDSLYQQKRSSDLLKVKSFHEIEATVIGIQPGAGKYTGQIGALRCQLPNGKTFDCGSGLTDSQRDPSCSYIGQTVTVKYFELSKDGIPRFPIFKGIRFDA